MCGKSACFVLVDYEAGEGREHVPELTEGAVLCEFMGAEVHKKQGEGSVEV